MKIFVITHKRYNAINMTDYFSLLVGASFKPQIDDYLRDDEGNNISQKNDSYCELTGLYWIWKNINDDIIGLVHYRRYFVKFDTPYICIRGKYLAVSNKKMYHILSSKEMLDALTEYDILVKESPRRNENTWDAFSRVFGISFCKDIQCIISDCYPQYVNSFNSCMHEYTHFNCNMFVSKKRIIDAYCEWLFPIIDLFDEKKISKTGERYHNRELGYIGEFLFKVWIKENHLRYKILPVVNIEDNTSVMTIGKFARFSIHWFKSKCESQV